MSTVLWANTLLNGTVTADESDKWALHKHSDKLDELTRALKLTPFSSLCDTTDAEFNMSDADLPVGMTSTNELMAQRGVWVDAAAAVQMLESLLAAIRTNKTRFGLLKNDHEDVVSELVESIAFAKLAADKGARFNFAIVM